MKTAAVRTKPTKYRNLSGADCYRRFRRNHYLLSGVGIALLILTAAVYIPRTEELSFWLYLMTILFLVAACRIVLWMNAAGAYHILYTDCDPVKFLEFLEVQRKKLKKPVQRSNDHLICAMAFAYLEDWDAVYRELTQFQAFRSKNRSLNYAHLNLLGDYCLAKGMMEDFESCRRQLLAMAEQGKPREKKQVDQILRVWDRRLAWIKKDRVREREILCQLLQEKKYLIQEVAWTFRLAQLDLLEGDLENARTRLRFVMEYGNTMAVRAWAEEIWNTQNETGEMNHEYDTE